MDRKSRNGNKFRDVKTIRYGVRKLAIKKWKKITMTQSTSLRLSLILDETNPSKNKKNVYLITEPWYLKYLLYLTAIRLDKFD